MADGRTNADRLGVYPSCDTNDLNSSLEKPWSTRVNVPFDRWGLLVFNLSWEPNHGDGKTFTWCRDWAQIERAGPSCFTVFPPMYEMWSQAWAELYGLPGDSAWEVPNDYEAWIEIGSGNSGSLNPQRAVETEKAVDWTFRLRVWYLDSRDCPNLQPTNLPMWIDCWNRGDKPSA